MEKCPLCGEFTNKPNTRLIKESCGHSKCRLCLINEESGCSVCEGSSGVASRLESIGNFDYHLPATTIPNYEELHSTPRKLDFNKIPDDFIDCPLDPAKLAMDNSINQNSDSVMANIPGPEKVDIGTETEKIVAEKDVQSQTVPQNTHSSSSQVTQTPIQPVAKVPEVFANTVSNNHQSHQEALVAQSPNFIPVTQRADNRQYITIAFIANNSPNKNQQVVAPLINQCLPTLAAVQRPGGNQCIPVLGNISALQNGNQIIIRSPNIVQNLVGNQSMPIVGNLPGNQSLSIVGNLNAVKNLVGNQSLPSLSALNPLQTPTKGPSPPTPGSPNVTQKVIVNHLHQVTQSVPKEVKEQSAPVQENTNATRGQDKTRGLPRIKTVKNVNIVQNSATNQSDKVRISRQIVETPVQGRGKRKRKELPVYLIPRKQMDQKKSPPAKNSPRNVGSMSAEYKLEDFVFFKRQLKASESDDSEIQTDTINDTQTIDKPSESVINEAPIVSDQFNATVIEDKFIENKVDIPDEENKVPNDKTTDEKITKNVSLETDECKEHQDLNVVFNIRDETKQTLDEKVEDEKEKIKIPSVEASSKDEYQNLDALFDIIEKESKKLNGSLFDKDEKSDLNEENGFIYEESQKLNEKMDNENDANQILNQEDNIEGEKDQNLNDEIDGKESEDQDLNLAMDSQNKEIENSNEKICCDNEENRNSLEINYGQEENLNEELPIQNGALLDGEAGLKENKHPNQDTEMKDQQEESEILDNISNSTFLHDEVVNEEEIQTMDENLVSVEKESENQVNEDVPLQEDDSNENDANDDKNINQCMNEKIDNEETSNQSHHEDINNEDKVSEELNNENQELPVLTGESNEETVDYEHPNESPVEAENEISNREDVDQVEETNSSLTTNTEKLDENTVEEESQIANREVVDEGEETIQSLTMETHEVEIASTPLDTENSLPTLETNDLDNSKLDATNPKEESIIVKKPRGRPKKSLTNHEHSKNLNTEVDETFASEAHMHENVNTSSTLVEMKKSENENAQFDAIKLRRGRKKKSFSDYELGTKPKSSNKNGQSLIKKPRGRSKKSLSSIEQPNKPNDLQEIDQPAVKELPSFCLKNNHENNNLDQSFKEEGQVLEVNVQIHNQEIGKNSMSSIHDKEESTNTVVNSTCLIKKPRGRPKTKNIPQNNQEESLQSDVDAISTFVEDEEPVVQKSDIVNENEQSTVVKKPRGRPKKIIIDRTKKSLTNIEQHNEHNVSQEIEMSINGEESKEQHERDEGEESQVLNREEFSQNSRVDEEKEGLHSHITTNPISSNMNESNAESTVSESPIKIKKSVGRPKKPRTSDVNAEPAVKRPRGRPKKSLSFFEDRNVSNLSQDTEISNAPEAVNAEESKEQHEKEENQVLDRHEFSQDETLQNSSMNINDREQENLVSNATANPTSSNINESNESNAENIVSESPIKIKKSVGRPKKLRASDVNVEPGIKRPRGRPKKSLSIFEEQNVSNVSQETATSTAHESSHDEERKEQCDRGEREESQTLAGEDCRRDETLEQSSVDVDNAEKEISHSNDTTNVTLSKEIESNVESTVNESSMMTDSRPEKSLTNNEPPNQSDASNVSVEPTVVKKSIGRPKKSLSIFEKQHPLVSQKTELSNQTEFSSSSNDNVNDKEVEKQHETEENQDLNNEDLEVSRNSNVDMNAGEKESLHSDVAASTIDNESDDIASNTTYLNDQVTITKIPMNKSKKSLNSSEQQKDPVVSNIGAEVVIVKKSRGRSKKSLSDFEQADVPVNSDLNGEDKQEKAQDQSFNGAIDKEEKKIPDKEIDGRDEKIQSSSTNVNNEDDDESILRNALSNKNPTDEKLETKQQSEQITIVKKVRERPKSFKPEGPVMKKRRGKRKRSNSEDQSESNLSKNKEHQRERKLPSFCTNYSEEKDEQQSLDENVAEGENRVLDREEDAGEESSQMEIPNEGNKSSVTENEKEKIDDQQEANDLVQNEDVEMKEISGVSEENDESQTQQQSCTKVSNNEGENVEEKDSQNTKAQDDENKENKKEYLEKEEAMAENVTPATEEQDSEKSANVDGEVSKNNTTGRKYKKFDAINAQVIVESSKRKRKPKVLLYENEDLKVSPLRKKKKELDKSSCKNEGKKSQFDGSTHANKTKQNSENTEITVKKMSVKNQLQVNEKTTSVDNVKLSRNVNEDSMDTEMNESNVSTTASSSKDQDVKGMKRHRRPKTSLHEKEDSKISSKNTHKKKVEFLLSSDRHSIDSDDIEKDNGVTEGNSLEVFTNEAKKSERVKKPKTLLYENERLSFTSAKEKDVKSEIDKEDLMIMKKFDIKLEPIVVLERNIDLSIIKKYDPDDNSLHLTHGNQETIRTKKPKSTVDLVKKPRGRPKLSTNKSKGTKVLGSKLCKLKLNAEKRRPGRPSKDYNHIIKLLSEESDTYQCTICSGTFKQYSNRNLHLKCLRKSLNSTLKSYKCEFCPKKFYHKTHWEYHERMHKGDKPFRCDLCGKKFIQKGKLNRHLLIHKYSQDLECNECGKKFISKEYLKSHLLSHVKSSFVFRCNQCPKSFRAESNRKRHELSHSRKKNYTCSNCAQQFGRLDNYNRHMLHHHTVQPGEELSPENTESVTPEVRPETPIIEGKKSEKKKDKSVVKPKKISRTSSNPIPMSISFIQPLTPQPTPSSYSISQNYDLASVIHETLPDLNNAVPVISAPISVQPSLSLMDPIPLEQALVLNRQIEEKIYTQSSFCEFPGLTRKANVTVVDHSQSFSFARRDSGDNNSNSNDGECYLTMNQEQITEEEEEEQEEDEEEEEEYETSPIKKDIHVHWRRRTAETFKSQIDQNK